MKTSMLVRLKPHDPKKGLLLKQYTYQGIRFQAGRGWYKVNGQVAAYLESVHSVPGDNDTPLAFDVCTPDEARAMDEKNRKAARQVVPAEQALDVSHVGDEQPRAKSRPGPDRDDALRRQRRDSDLMPENMQPNALDNEGMEDENPRRRPSRRRAGAVSRRPRAVVEDFGELDDGDDPEDDDVENEALRRRARRGRAGGVPRRRLWAEDEELDDVEPGDEVDEFDGDEFDDELEDAPPLAHRRCSLPPRSRAPRARPIQRYAVEHGALDDDDRQIRRVRGPRQAEALDALRNREARRMRRQHTLDDRHEELPRSRSQGWYQDELHIRHARQMAAKLEEIDALDDAMSHGDAEDSRPNDAKRNRHDGHGDAEDSLPTTTRSKHVSQRDAEDSLPGRATRYGDAEDSLPGKGARSRHSGHGDAEDSLSTRDRHSYGDAEDSLPHRRKQQDAPSSRHTADAQDDLEAVEQALDHRNVEEPARSDARSQRFDAGEKRYHLRRCSGATWQSDMEQGKRALARCRMAPGCSREWVQGEGSDFELRFGGERPTEVGALCCVRERGGAGRGMPAPRREAVPACGDAPASPRHCLQPGVREGVKACAATAADAAAWP